jgi:hypothetical protein
MRASLLLVLTAACGRLSFGSSSDDAAVADASLDASRKIAPACGTNVLLADDFTDTMPAPLFTCDPDPGVSCSESGGQLSMVLTPPVSMYRFAFYSSVSTYPLGGLCVTVDVATLPGDDAAIFYKVVAARESEFIIARTFLGTRTQTSNVVDSGSYAEIVADPAWHYWRLRSQSSNAYWDASADGVTYYELREIPGLFTGVSSARIIVGAGSIRDTTMPTSAAFESIEATGP